VLVRRNDPVALARALSDLLADPGRRQDLAARGSEVAARYDWQVLARRILTVYETVLPADGGAVTADPDAEFPAVPPAGSATRPPRIRRARR
jgi:phosphatidyl-myo-inositol alpha-mannosyltransferase